MKKVLVFAFLVTAMAAAHAESCQPNFVVEHERCNDSSKVIGMTPKTDQIDFKREREDRSGRELVNAFCGARQAELAGKWKVPQDDIQMSAENKDTREPWVEASLTHQAVGTYHKIICSYSAQAPVFEKTSEGCPEIVAASDTNKCFSADRVSVDPSVVTDCEYRQPKNMVEAWQKAECLVEAYTAAKESRMILPGSGFEMLEGAMNAYSHGAPNQTLKAYLRTELQSK